MDRYFYGKVDHGEIAEKDRYSALKIFVILIVVILTIVIVGYSTYSSRGFTWIFYPYSNSKSFVMCIEGEIKPTGQRIIIKDAPDDGMKTINPLIEVNEGLFSFSSSEYTSFCCDIIQLLY